MEIAKKFLGEDQGAASIDEVLFNKLFYSGANKDIIVIKSKIPIPSQDIGTQQAHNDFEFTIPLSHSPSLLIEKKQFTLPRRNIFPSNPGQYHGPADIAQNHRIIALQFSAQELQNIGDTLFSKRTIEFHNNPVPLSLYMENLIEMFIYESKQKQACHEFILEHISSVLGAMLLRTLDSNVALQEKLLNGVSKRDINRAIDYLHSNINQDFSLADLANLAGLSKYHFMRVFKKETGKTPYHYYIDIKIEKAIELIKTQKYNITEICFMCGFKDHSHFSRIFKSKTGMTPSHFKVMCK